MKRHAGHLDRIAVGGAALRQRDAEQARGFFGIVEKQFVKIAHPIEHERGRIVCFDAQILLHHRSVFFQRIVRAGRLRVAIRLYRRF